MPESRNATVRPLETSDIPVIAEFLSREMGRSDTDWRSMMQHWWQQNPAFDESVARGWLIEDAAQIVGVLANIPTKFQCNGDELTSYNPSTWYVSPAYRKTAESRQLFHQFAAAADQTLSFITTPARHVVRFYREELQYRDFPELPQHYGYFVYNHARYLRLQSSRKARLLHTALLPLYRLLQKQRLPAPQSTFTVRPLSATRDAVAIQQLWEAARRLQTQTHWRDAETVKWLMSGHRSDEKMLYGCFADNTLQALGLFMRKHSRGRDALECLDLFSPDNEPAAYAAIVEHVIRNPARADCAFLKVPLFHQAVSQACQDLRLRVHPLQNYYMVRYGKHFTSRLAQGQCWLTGIQGDYALF